MRQPVSKSLSLIVFISQSVQATVTFDFEGLKMFKNSVVVALCFTLCTATLAKPQDVISKIDAHPLPVSGPRPLVDAVSESERASAIERAVDWLLDYCVSEPAFKSGMVNEAVQFQVVQCETALLLVLHPTIFKDDDRRDKVIAKAEEIVRRHHSGPLTTWLSGFGALYLAETSTRRGRPHEGWKAMVDFWVNSQNREGGWGHADRNLMGEFYPSTLISSSNFGLIALGAAKELGHRYADDGDFEDVVDEALEMFKTVQSSQGGLPYGARSYLKGPQAGRTAGSLIGLAALGKTEDALFTKGVCYVTQNVRIVPYGHASPAMHALTGALSFAMLGGDPWIQFQRLHFSTLLKFQQPDGTFDDFANGPDSISLLSGERSAAGYRTASYAIALSADKSQWIQRLSQSFTLADVLAKGKQAITASLPKTLDSVTTPSKSSTPVAQWTRPNVTHSTTDTGPSDTNRNERIGLVHGGETFELIGVPDGQVQSKWKFSDRLKQDDSIRLVDDKMFVFRSAKNHQNLGLPLSQTLKQGNANTAPETQVECYGVSVGELRWVVKIGEFIEELWLDERVEFIGFSGKDKFAIDLESGELSPPQSFLSLVNNVSMTSSPRGDVFLSAVACTKIRAGQTLWKTPFKSKRGVTQTAAQSSVFHAGYLFVTTTDGNLLCLDGETGKLVWKRAQTKIAQVVAMATMADRVFLVGTSDGVVTAVPIVENTNHQPLWQTSTFVGQEARRGCESTSTGITALVVRDRLVVWNKLSQTAVVLDGASGQPEFHVQNSQQVLVTDNHIIVSGQNRQRVFKVN